MTEKQEKILTAALELFATNGYASTSTAKVAREAGVSEGLIFRHFGNKEGLLKAIIDQGQQKATEIYQMLAQEQNPRKRLRNVLDMSFSVSKEDHTFWRLIYALKWQADAYDSGSTDLMKQMLIDTFKELHHEDPEAEAELILILLDGLVTAILLRKPKELNRVQNLLHRRYML